MEFNNAEKAFLKRAIKATKADFEGELDLENKDDLIHVVNEYRSQGLMPGVRVDDGKEHGLWTAVRNKLGSPVKTHKELLDDQRAEQAEAELIQISKVHDSKIKHLQEKLQLAKIAKLEAQKEVQEQIEAEIAAIEAKKKDAIERLEVSKTARKKLAIDRDIKKLDAMRNEILNQDVEEGMGKCWTCGEVFKIRGGAYTKHVKTCKEG